QLLGSYSNDLHVLRNDKASVDDIRALNPRGIVISPGPGRPENAGICVDLIRGLGTQIPILGVCLGHQAIGYAFGARISHAPTQMHGKISRIYHQHDPIFCDMTSPFEATRYHSLVIAGEAFPTELVVTASTEDNIIMGVKHREYPIDGIQFHPESILTREGPTLISNWIKSLKGSA
ncbi:MAG TPA: aminodeoxychorismate/anthranilate synthase component II, partial [Bacteroidota bacterium]|nr:aminodeoxychorismate/anthranilate synthase component II [Bacteroidota bacterium]